MDKKQVYEAVENIFDQLNSECQSQEYWDGIDAFRTEMINFLQREDI